MEVLASRLSEALGTAGPLQSDTVIVPNPGVARWLWLYLAGAHGISANLDCVLPGSFIWRVFHRLLPDVPERSPYEPAVMAWRLHRLLREIRGDAAFSQLLDWRDTTDDRRRFELARRLAAVFDQYIVYRPDWIERWLESDGGGWQAELWRRLAAGTAQPDWMGLWRRLQALPPEQVTAAMPASVNLFGIPLLSPGYLQVLNWLGAHIDVNLFLPNPCREYWGHIVADRELPRRAGVEDEKRLYLETGNALLASWGGQGRDLLDLIQELGAAEEDRFETPGGDTMLHAVQTQILELRNPGVDDQPAEPVDREDRSIAIHVCHSPTRELEVLRDQLLALFDADETLSASDVVVMTPDIDAYAPLIDAVFSTPGHFPFHIADLDPRHGLALIETFIGLFELRAERFDANRVMSVLDLPAVHRHFGLAESDLPQLRDWVRDTGIRWGLDGADRAAHGRGDDGLHSWRRGLDRLMLGFALPGERVGPFNGVLPFDEVEGSSAVMLGGFAEFISRLENLAAGAGESRTAAGWSTWLHRQLDALFDIREDEESEAQVLRNAINSIGEVASLAGHDETVGVELVLDWLTEQLGANRSLHGFLGHGVTFSGIVPMRNVPFRVICLIGVNDGAFPRIESPVGFDLIARDPRRGDRSRRDDDRLAFLDSLMNARDVFYLSYVGRGVRDDAPIPPSVLVSELVDYCNRAFESAAEEPVGNRLRTFHRVQPFSPRYFDGSDPSLFSYSDLVAPLVDSQERPGDFFADALAPADDDLMLIDLDDLVRFFANPARAVLKSRLGISYEGDSDPLDTDDPVQPDNLATWSLGDTMLDLRLAGRSREEALEIALNSRHAPAGRVGDIVLGGIMNGVDKTFESLKSFVPAGEPQAASFELEREGVTVSGRLTNLYPSGQYLWRYGRTRGKDRLALWIRHLALNVERPAGIAAVSNWLGRDTTLGLTPVTDAGEQLGRLLALYRRGLREPIPFFPDSAWIYVSQLGEKGADKALSEARKKFRGAYKAYDFTEDSNAYWQRLFSGGVDWEEFAELARRVYEPIVRHHAS